MHKSRRHCPAQRKRPRMKEFAWEGCCDLPPRAQRTRKIPSLQIIGRWMLSPQRENSAWPAHAITNQGRTDPPFPAA